MSNSEHSTDYSVSVVIPAYNSGKHIGRAIDSVLAQSRPADEIIVVDDGSADNTVEVVEKYGSKIKLIKQSNAGASTARNTGIEAAAGEWIAFLDADDEWLPEKLQRQIEHLKRNPQLQWATANYLICLCTENRTAPDLTTSFCKKYLGGRDYLDNYITSYRDGFTGHTNTMLIKKTLLKEAQLFRPLQKRFNDLDLWLRIAYLETAIGFIAEPLAIHHLEAIEGISVRFRDPDIHIELIQRHAALADRYGKSAEFRQLARFLLRLWIRGMLFESKQSANIRRMLKQFPGFLSLHYRLLIHALIAFPKITERLLRGISVIVRALNLRRRIVRKPPKIQKEK